MTRGRILWSRHVGIPPDLGRTETEVLGDAFDAIANLVSRPSTGSRPATSGDVAKGGISGGEGEGRRKRATEDGFGGGDKAPGAKWFEATRVPASEVVRILCSGAVDEYRRASPALSAACIYKELAEGLEVASTRKAEDGARRTVLGNSTDKGDHPSESRNTNKGARHSQQQGDADDEDDRGRGVSREEFCDYFEAVTDLVDLNGLSLVPQVHQGLAHPTAVGV